MEDPGSTDFGTESSHINVVYVLQGLYWDNGKENGNYYIMIGYV